MNKKLLSFIVALFSVIIITVFISTGVQIWNFGKIDQKAPADVIIVLGAKSTGGEVSEVLKQRVNHGIWLYNNGYADYIIFTGGFGKGESVSEAAAAKKYAIEQGVSESAIFIEEKSTITEENFFEAKNIMDENSFSSAIIVSDPLHQKRAMLMASDYGIETAFSSPTQTSAYKTFKTKAGFLLREQFMLIGYRVVRIFRK